MVDLGSLFWDDFNPIGTVMAKSKKHKWAFRARFRTGAYGWRGTKIAKQRLREAVKRGKKAESAPKPLKTQHT